VEGHLGAVHPRKALQEAAEALGGRGSRIERGMLYDDWLSDVARRFQQKFDNIKVTHNFDYGDEFEVALCEVLQEILPRRFGVCRGFVVGRNGERAGDDIIVYDAQHFPTLRALATDLSRKESIPAEAVLAYIEAKHTLSVEGDGKSGQSLAKAMSQIDAVKAIPRPPVEHHQILRGANLHGFNIQGPAGFPQIRNPYYSAIWARHVKSTESDTFAAFARRLLDLGGSRAELPDAIAADSVLALPLVREGEKVISVKPFVCETTELGSVLNNVSSWGIAVAHMLWAIEWVRLGDLPWSTMLIEQLKIENLGLAEPPLRGTKFGTSK
jgi:hypothetical protein